MKKLTNFAILLSVIVLTISCIGDEQGASITNPETKTLVLNDTLIFYHDGYTSTFKMPCGTGHYHSCPCLAINKLTGEIKSQYSTSGIYYPVWFSKGQDSILTYVLISGIRYRAGNYNLQAGEKFAKPYYNDDINLSVPAGSEFDTPPPGIAPLKDQGVMIHPSTGIIDLEKTLSNIFGPGAKDGDFRSFRLYYKLNDISKFALNFTDIAIYYPSSGTSSPEKAQRTSDTSNPNERCNTPIVPSK